MSWKKTIAMVVCLVVALTIKAQTADQAQQEVNRKYDAFFLEAVSQRMKDNNDAAFDLLRHCIAIDSTKSEAWFYLGEYYDALRQKDLAQRCVERAAELDPTISTYQETLANLYIGQQQYDKATDVLERLYKSNHDREDVLATLFSLYRDQKRFQDAIHVLERLETQEGKSPRYSLYKTQIYTEMGDQKAAIREMKELADQHPNDLNYRTYYATTLISNGQKKEGYDIYREVVSQEPNNRDVLMALLAYEQQYGEPETVDSLMERVLVCKNVDSDDRAKLLRQQIAESEQNGGDSTRVLYLFHQVMKLQPLDTDVAMLCAAYMELKKMPQDSIMSVLEQVIQAQPDESAARFQLVSYAWNQEDARKVIDLCQGGRMYNPDEMAFYYYQGVAYYKQDNLNAALDAFQNGIGVITQESDPDIVSDFYAVMGDIYHQKGLDDKAYAAYDSCLQWKEDNVGCLNNYAYFLSQSDRQLDKAEQMSYRTIKAEPQNSTYLDTYAWILFRQKRYAEAKVYIDQTLQCDTALSVEIIEHAGDIYYYVGNKAKALEYWKQALEKEQKELQERGTGHAEGDRTKILARKIKLKKFVKQ